MAFLNSLPANQRIRQRLPAQISNLSLPSGTHETPSLPQAWSSPSYTSIFPCCLLFCLAYLDCSEHIIALEWTTVAQSHPILSITTATQIQVLARQRRNYFHDTARWIVVSSTSVNGYVEGKLVR